MNELLRKAYAIHDAEPYINQKPTRYDAQSEYYYFIITLNDLEPFHLEEISLTHYLIQAGEERVAEPIRNIHGNWFTFYNGEQYAVFRQQAYIQEKTRDSNSYGRHLANFHKQYRTYPKQFEYILSYGSWQALWLNRLSYYENEIKNRARNSQLGEQDPYIELFPYMLSLTENAIQYVNETEKEKRMSTLDTPTVTFKRYESQMLDEVILPTELIIDHPMRDVAESLRHLLLYEENDMDGQIKQFLSEYQAVEPLSIYSWRLLYGRLLYPAHYYDLLDQFLTDEKGCNQETFSLFSNRQTRYEDRLAKLFTYVGIQPYMNQIPIVDWLLY